MTPHLAVGFAEAGLGFVLGHSVETLNFQAVDPFKIQFDSSCLAKNISMVGCNSMKHQNAHEEVSSNLGLRSAPDPPFCGQLPQMQNGT